MAIDCPSTCSKAEWSLCSVELTVADVVAKVSCSCGHEGSILELVLDGGSTLNLPTDDASLVHLSDTEVSCDVRCFKGTKPTGVC